MDSSTKARRRKKEEGFGFCGQGERSGQGGRSGQHGLTRTGYEGSDGLRGRFLATIEGFQIRA